MLSRNMVVSSLSILSCALLIVSCGKDEAETDYFDDTQTDQVEETTLSRLSEIEGYSCIEEYSYEPSGDVQVVSTDDLLYLREQGPSGDVVYFKAGERLANFDTVVDDRVVDGELFVISQEGGEYTAHNLATNAVSPSFSSIIGGQEVSGLGWLQLVEKEGSQYVLIDTQLIGPFDAVSSYDASGETGTFFVYGSRGDDWFINVSGQEKQVTSGAYIVLTHDGKDVIQLYYPNEGENTLVIGGQEVVRQNQCSYVTYADGHHLYDLFDGDDAFIVYDGQKIGPFEGTRDIYLSPDGTKYAFFYVQDGDLYVRNHLGDFGPFEAIYRNDQYERDYVQTPRYIQNGDDFIKIKNKQEFQAASFVQGNQNWYGHFSQDGESFAFGVKDGSVWDVFLDDTEINIDFESITEHYFVTDDTGENQLVIIGKKDGKDSIYHTGSGELTQFDTTVLDVIPHNGSNTTTSLHQYRSGLQLYEDGSSLGAYGNVQDIFFDKEGGNPVYIVTTGDGHTLLDGEEKVGPLAGEIGNVSFFDDGSYVFSSLTSLYFSDGQQSVLSGHIVGLATNDSESGFDLVMNVYQDDGSSSLAKYACTKE